MKGAREAHPSDAEVAAAGAVGLLIDDEKARTLPVSESGVRNVLPHEVALDAANPEPREQKIHGELGMPDGRLRTGSHSSPFL